jgi:tRNA(fMet)-specific endonuclease VapC
VKYLLDTNAIIALTRGQQPLSTRIRQHRVSDFGVSSLVFDELYYGAYNSQRARQNLSVVDTLAFAVLDFDRQDAQMSGEIRATLRRAGTPVGSFDVLIAGQALARNLILITRNTSEFQRIPRLKLQDWQI